MFCSLGAVSSYFLIGYKFIAILFSIYLWAAELKRRVRISRNRNEVEGQGVKINNTSSLRKRDLYLAHNSKGIVYPSREGMVAEGTQSLAVGACDIACLHRGRSQNRPGLFLSRPILQLVISFS